MALGRATGGKGTAPRGVILGTACHVCHRFQLFQVFPGQRAAKGACLRAAVMGVGFSTGMLRPVFTRNWHLQDEWCFGYLWLSGMSIVTEWMRIAAALSVLRGEGSEQ